ncbi:S-layer homology domain-containing protein [Microcoleus sp. PH2017_08_TRC_O_A]|uniref:S-layer homology domain-containing protein n=1 Tax=Microcoleus sp. PH2017_08_TRC_O_A TaxID=2798819 RepID=UPI001DD56A10|nr:S-layer homology domain-containing protein [Microcoleus sp. PH2017_08_TRC_O_A]MCC3452891.1 S-layer homology domain-containing protein [Microcoleus sp. PH2017_08_TRC_O_A]TAE68645.1 MAG: S-layer homology domain-containing protein [Oscillatoriales cyanobacterium]TAG63730.1 MAG: S-layer homology domain-containing protein [Oscillatoriales cyanobacterium]
MSSSQPPSGKRKPLGFDELIAIVVAFGTMGAIFFWVTGRNPDRLNARSWQFPAVFSQPAAEPGNSTILTPPEAIPEVRSPARTILPSQPDVVPVAPVGPLFPVVPPMGTVVVPETPSEREAVPPVITKPKVAKPKAGPVKFSDVPDKYWARPFIVALADRQFFADFTDNKFRPDEPITRSELARLIQGMSDKEPRRKPINFKDVKNNSPIAGAIDHSVKTGYLKGYPDNAFRPDKEVPRVEVIAALASGLNLKPSAKASRTLQVYTDRKKVPKWAVNKVAAATEAGIVVNNPKPTLLQPNKIATRAEVAAMIYEAMAKQGKVPVKPSDYVMKPVKPSK